MVAKIFKAIKLSRQMHKRRQTAVLETTVTTYTKESYFQLAKLPLVSG